MIRESLINTSGTGIRSLCGLAMAPSLVLLLGAPGYGRLAVVLAVIALGSLGDGGASLTATAHLAAAGSPAEARRIHRWCLRTAACGFLLVAAGVLLVAEVFVVVLEKAPELRPAMAAALHWSVLAIGMRIVSQLVTGMLTASRRYFAANLLSTTQAAVTLVTMVVAARMGYGTAGLIAAFSLGQAPVIFFLGVLLRPHSAGDPEALPGQLPRSELGAFARGAWGAAATSSLYAQFDKPLAAMVLGPEALGLYCFAANAGMQISYLVAAAIHPLLPNLKTHPDTAGQTIAGALRLNAGLSLGLGAASAAAAPFLVPLLLPGTRDPRAIQTVVAATTWAALFSLNSAGYYLLLAAGRSGTICAVQAVAAIGSLCALLAGGWGWGAWGAAQAGAGYQCVWFLSVIGFGGWGVPVRHWASRLLPSVLGLALVLAGCVFLPSPIVLSSLGVAGLLVAIGQTRIGHGVLEEVS